MDDFLTYEDIKKRAKNQGFAGKITEIEDLLAPEDITFLWNQVNRLEDITELEILESYLDRQKELGAWVTELLPSPIEKIVGMNFTDDPGCHYDVMVNLSRQRDNNLRAVESLGEYPLEFQGNDLKGQSLSRSSADYPEDWKVELDTSALTGTIDLFSDHVPDGKTNQASTVASSYPNQQMLNHRRNLGYLPEPITGEEDLAELLKWGASRDPADMIWKWLHPMNIFDFSDIFLNLKDYKRLLKTIHQNWDYITNSVLSTLSTHLGSTETMIEETFAVTVGYGIRGWATDDGFGVNIEYLKDDFQLLLGTLAHELLHRIQPNICPTYHDGQSDSPNLEDLTAGPFDDPKDEKFYELLTYIFLEGSGEFIKHEFKAGPEEELLEGSQKGIDLLEKGCRKIYEEDRLDQADKVLSRGLSSNGPFYALGEFMTRKLIENKPEGFLGEALEGGSLRFFLTFQDLEQTDLDVPVPLRKKITSIYEKLNSTHTGSC
ncbi:MAG: DUF5700 domain-containing putative Zn-dependent protease [Candidatus Bipolaricaulota bacterium]